MEAASQFNSTIILALKNEVVADVFALAFEGVLRAHIIACKDIGEAIKAMRDNPDACLVVEPDVPGEPISVLFQRQATLARRSHVFVLGGSSALIPANLPQMKVEFLPAVPMMAELVAKVESAMHLEALSLQFCKITLKSLLIRSSRLRCDVYLKLSNEKFVKVLHANDRFDLDEYERFQHKNVNFLYLPRADFLGLMDDLLEKVAVLNGAPGDLSIEDAVSTNIAIFETVHAAFETEGFTPQLQKLTVASVDLAVNTIKKNPRLSELLGRFESGRDSYIGWHSTALSFLCCKLATLLGWQSDSTFFKLSLAAMLHDLTLPTDAMAKIRTKAELEASDFSDEEKAIIMRHPSEAAQLINAFEEIPGEVGFIVEQHHERQDGTGFPRGVDHKDVNSIAALFIIAHDVVATMFESPADNFKMADFLTAREADKIYTKGSFGQVFRALVTKSDEML